jgi:glycosyltransferase involved in cell wall biosynthesis
MKKVSIIIPVFNTAEYLAECLDSVLNQTYNNVEIILVDDGSTDGSENICDSYANKDQRVCVFHKKNEGVSAARNFGIQKSTGAYLAFFDSDDTILPNMIEDLMNLYSLYEVDIVKSSCFVGWKDTTGKALLFSRDDALNDLFTLRLKVHPSMCLGIYRKELFDNNAFPDNIHFFEDYAVLCNLVKKSKGIALLDKSYYYYRERSGSASRSGMNRKRWSMKEIPGYLEFNNVYRNKNDKRNVIFHFVGFYIFQSVLLNEHTKEDEKILRKEIQKNWVDILLAKDVAIYRRIAVLTYLFTPGIVSNILRHRKHVFFH